MSQDLSVHQRRRPPSRGELDGIPWLGLLEAEARERAVATLVVGDAKAGDYVCRVGRPVTYWFGLVDGLLTAVSRAAGSMWGNIVFGGGIGAIIDHNKGTGYDYPTTLPVEMGKSVSVDRAQEKQQQQLQQQAAADCRNNGSTC